MNKQMQLNKSHSPFIQHQRFAPRHIYTIPITPIEQANPRIMKQVDTANCYDIQKTTTTDLLNQNKFMGQNTELVLLFQAAEIQRLNNSLQQYQTKIKDISVKQLDRHSYQTQIKQLSSVLNELNLLKTQNQGLKDFIRKQAILLDSTDKTLDTYNPINHQKHQNYQKQMQILIKQKNELILEFNTSKQKLRCENEALVSEIQLLRINNDSKTLSASQHNQQRNQKYQERIEQYEIIVGKLNSQIKRLCNITLQKTSQFTQYTNRINVLQQQIEDIEASYEEQTERLQTTLKQKQTLHQQFLALQSKCKQYQTSTLIIKQYQQTSNKYHQQIQQLNQIVRLKDAQIQRINSKNKVLEQQSLIIKAQQSMVESLKAKIEQTNHLQINNTQQINEQYNIKIQRLVEENTRLKENFKLSSTTIQKINTQLVEVKNVIIDLRSENQKIKTQAAASKAHAKKIQYENRILLLSQELQRLNGILLNKNNQMALIRNQINQINMKYQMMCQQNHHYKLEINSLQQSFQIQQQSESRNMLLNNEIIRLNKQLQMSSKQSIQLVKRINQYEGLTQTIDNFKDKIDKLVNENNVLTSDIKTAQQKIILSSNQYNAIRTQNQNLRKATNKEDNTIEKLKEQILRLSVDLQNLNEVVLVKQSQNINLQQKLNILSQQIQQLKLNQEESTKYEMISKDHQNQIILLTKDLQKIATSLQTKDNEYNQLFNEMIELRHRQNGIAHQNQRLKQKLTSQTSVNSNTQMQIDLISLTSEIQRINNLMTAKSLQAQQYENKFRFVVEENNQLKMKLQSILQNKGTIDRNIESQMIVLQQQNQRLNHIIKETSLNSTRVQNDFINLQSKFQLVSQENQELKRRGKQILSLTQTVTQYEQMMVTITNQINRLNGVIQSKNNLLKAQGLEKNQLLIQLQSMKQSSSQSQQKQLNEMNNFLMKVSDYEQKINMLTLEIMKLSGVSRGENELINSIMRQK